jgi:hypothetical protein
MTEFSEGNGAVPPKIHLPEPEFASESESMNAPSLRGFVKPSVSIVKVFHSSFIFPGSDGSIQDADAYCMADRYSTTREAAITFSYLYCLFV